MGDNDIKKALERCTTNGASCKDCPAFVKVDRSNCKKYFRGALDLINRLEAERDNLKETLDRVIGETKGLRETNKELQAENEKLKNSLAISEKETKRYVQGYKMACSERNEFLGQLETAKAEAYKEFAERLKQVFCKAECDILIRGIVDDLLKEMVGEDK
jgi:FtsZ-binding cell division protein ZapB